ncbi:hypothetical protein SFUMM280S_04274 [Streptomyces fumanus]
MEPSQTRTPVPAARGLVGEDLHRAVLGERGGGVAGAVAQRDGDRLADAAGQGQQLQGRLADGTVHVVDVDEDFGHGTSFLPARIRRWAVGGAGLR